MAKDEMPPLPPKRKLYVLHIICRVCGKHNKSETNGVPGEQVTVNCKRCGTSITATI